MILSKEDTYSILYRNRKQKAINKKYTYTTKYKWWCLCCLKVIYISYTQYGRNSIFCTPCYIKNYNFQTIVQYQYMRILKERQMKLIENQTTINL